MTLQFIFPYYLDKPFIHERNIAIENGFGVWKYEDMDSRLMVDHNSVAEGNVFVYRGWMLTTHEYQHLQQSVENAGGRMLTSWQQYAYCHYLPNWVDAVQAHTFATWHMPCDVSRVTTVGVQNFLANRGWGCAVIKDYCKSQKHTGNIVSLEHPEWTETAVQALRDFAREDLNGGLVIREWEPIDKLSEVRVVVLNGEVLYCTFHPDLEQGVSSPPAKQITAMIREFSARIPSAFYTADFAYNMQEKIWRLVEIGDGQVSQLDNVEYLYQELSAL